MMRNVRFQIGLSVLCAVAPSALSHAAPLQLQGQLTIFDLGDQFPGTIEYTLRVRSGLHFQDLLGESFLQPDPWPGLGEDFTGAFAVDFLSPGPGVVDLDPIRVDGQTIQLLVIELTGLLPSLGGSVTVETLGTLEPLFLGTVNPPPNPQPVGAVRFDAVVPEPATGVMLGLLLVGILRRSLGSRRQCRVDRRRQP